ncbi:FxLD family lanthipeptide [Streptomyces sp. AN-3]|uniref:FxLD family lanthipeptide n=1 Tax=Streptomyces sp. AN-3 TaxID=3044177 RepID=UPI00249ABDF7|nr:FxLD family lanthipeptide [Streptomyces sp. AN-3]MDI3102054.1 FxLD family lanthipeptide [Streptomyces sp. AN-3]MDV6291300.1 FxLD family lanthipeptide [Streptomyces sp. UP1A-1]
MATATAPLTTTTVEAPLSDEWELDTTITRSPAPIVEACDTNDGCASSCASSCTSS